MSLLRSVTTVGGCTMGSRIVGFIREVATASFVGAGAAGDALIYAIKLPSFFRRIFAEGAFNASFVPQFAGLLATEGKDAALQFSRQILTILTLVLSLLTLFVEWGMPGIIQTLVPGFTATPERLELTILFSRVTFPFILFISLTALVGGILNSFDRFVAVASSPMIGNIFIVAAVFMLHDYLVPNGYAFAVAVGLSGIVQLLWVWIPCYKAGMRLSFARPTANPALKKFFTTLLPGAFGASVVQINVFAGSYIASWLPTGSISYLYFADRLNQLPLSVVGVAISTALLPLLSRQIRSNATADAHNSQNEALEIALLLVLPATIALVMLSEPLIVVFFQHGAFTAKDAFETAKTLSAVACGLPAYVMMKVFCTSFFARQDMRTPIVTATIAVGIDIGLSLYWMGEYQHVGIALATAVSAWVNALLLGGILYHRGQLQFSRYFIGFMGKLVPALALTIAMLYGMTSALQPLLHSFFTLQVAGVVLLVLGGVVGFFAAARLTGAVDFKKIKAAFKAKPPEELLS